MAARNTKMATDSSDRVDIRTLQALDQAAGGSGDIRPEQAEQRALTTSPPEHGTDDARCEDSSLRTFKRKQTADEVFSQISRRRIVSRSGKVGKRAMLVDRTTGASNRRQERADAEIQADIERRLKADQLLDDTSIFVAVSRGRVIIEGSVDSHEARQRAEAISRQAAGIVGHDSNLAVRKSP